MFAGSTGFDQDAYWDMWGHLGSWRRRMRSDEIADLHEKDVANDYIHAQKDKTETRVCSLAKDRFRVVETFRTTPVKMMRFRLEITDGSRYERVQVINSAPAAGEKVQASIHKQGDKYWDGQFGGLSITLVDGAVKVYTDLFPTAHYNTRQFDEERNFVEVLIWNKIRDDEHVHAMRISCQKYMRRFHTDKSLIAYMNLELRMEKGWIWQASTKQFANWEALELALTTMKAEWNGQEVTTDREGWYKVSNGEYKSCRSGYRAGPRGLLYASACRLYNDRVQPTECVGRFVLKGTSGKDAACCSNGRFYNSAEVACKACGHRCASCEEAGADHCTSCRLGFKFEDGKNSRVDGPCVKLEEHEEELAEFDNNKWDCATKSTRNICGRCVPKREAGKEYEKQKALDCSGAMQGMTTADKEEGASAEKDWQKRIGLRMSQTRILAECGTCASDYSEFHHNGKCNPCSKMYEASDQAHCKQCLTKDVCLVCSGDYVMNSGHCCRFNAFWAENRCQNCHHQCVSCNGPDRKDCTGCKAGRMPMVRAFGKAGCRLDYTGQWNRDSCIAGFTMSNPDGVYETGVNAKWCAPIIVGKKTGNPAQPCDTSFNACGKNPTYSEVPQAAKTYLLNANRAVELGFDYGSHSACWKSVMAKCEATTGTVEATDPWAACTGRSGQYVDQNWSSDSISYPAAFLKNKAMYNFEFVHKFAAGRKFKSQTQVFTHHKLSKVWEFHHKIEDYATDSEEETQQACEQDEQCTVSHAYTYFGLKKNNRQHGIFVAIRGN